MFIRIWSENIHFEKNNEGHAENFDEAIKRVKELLDMGYMKAWIEVQKD